MRILITGLCGFIGHHVADHFLRDSSNSIVGIDRIDGTSTLHRLRYIERWEEKVERVDFIWHDLRAPVNDWCFERILRGGEIDVILHLAASTHVDRSIDSPSAFIQDNVVGTYHALELARRMPEAVFVYFSTDEIFGPAPEGTAYKEWDRARPGNPYAATKSAAEDLTISYHNTYGVKAIVTHCMNVVGRRQHKEKFLPMVVGCVLRGEKIYVHADKTKTVPGSRGYLSAARVARALDFLLQHFEVGEKYNIAAEREIDNLAMARTIAAYVDRPLEYELVDFHSTRPGHDLRYALDGTKLYEMGFHPGRDLDETIRGAVEFCLKHPEWT